MTFRFGRFFVLTFSLCLLTSVVISSANAQTTSGTPASSSEGSETCNPEIQERMQEESTEARTEVVARATQTFQSLPPTAETVCLDDQIASASNTVGSVFSDNPDFFNSVKNTITLPSTISNSVLNSLASVLGGNPLSSGSIGNLLGGVLGFTMPSQCDGMQTMFENEFQRNIDIAGSINPLEEIGLVFPGSSSLLAGLGIGSGGTNPSLATPVPNNRVPDGECRKYVNFTDSEGKEFGGCDAGQNAVCVVEYTDKTFTCNKQ